MVPVALRELPTVPFAYKRASRAFRTATICPVCEQWRQPIEALFGAARIRRGRRLTGFGFARKIIRIRTISSVVTDEPHRLVGADLQAFTW
jgi:hypothetical protein